MQEEHSLLGCSISQYDINVNLIIHIHLVFLVSDINIGIFYLNLITNLNFLF